MASHEFRTPLSTILSSVSLISKYNTIETEEKRVKHINRIKSSVGHLTDLLNDFLSLDKLEEGMIHSNPDLFDIVDFCEEITQEMQVVAKEGQLVCYENFGEKNVVSLDSKLVRNILINLLSNAIKFSPEGKEIQLQTFVAEKEIKITVKDSGIGIPKEDQLHLFERFFRGQNATNIQGTGLGLNIVTKYVELMNGTIKFETELNKGTTFIINLPI